MSLPARTETALKGLPGGSGTTYGVRAPGQGIYEQSSYPKHRLGEVMRLFGGRVFYYGYFGESCAAGKVVAPDSSDNDEAETDDIIVVSGNYGGAIGDKKIEITLASQTKDDFREGTFHTTDDTFRATAPRYILNPILASPIIEYIYDKSRR